MFFRGAYNITLDAKGRFAMPTRYRDDIAGDANAHLIATIGPAHRCVRLYPLPAWEEIERKLAKLPSLNPVAQSLQMLMIGNATDVEMDAQGRVLVPPKLREFAALNRDVMLIGQGTRFDLWDELQWEAQREQCLKTDFSSVLPPELSSLSF